ncbi:MAG: hypothetical protein NXI24_17925 [bacterium]|nr:hypothetical protein [bacterium]
MPGIFTYSKRIHAGAICVALCCALAATPVRAQGAGDAPEFVEPPASANAGYFSLNWRMPESSANAEADDDPTPRFEIQEGTNADFTNPRLIYRGPETATTVSGKADGDYFYRVRKIDARNDQSWSAVHTVRVVHHPLNRAFAFLLLGGVVFLATAFLILRGDADRGKSDAGGAP